MLLGLILLAFWYGRRTANKNKTAASDTEPGHKAELENIEARKNAELATTANTAEMGAPLDEEEKKELERRRRAAELEGSSPAIPGDVSERAELETRRKQVFEMS